MRRDADFYGDRELALVYIAKKLKEAQGLEALLTERGLDYLVEADSYVGGFLFRSERVGAFFYVALELEQAVRTVMAEKGYKPYRTDG